MNKFLSILSAAGMAFCMVATAGSKKENKLGVIDHGVAAPLSSRRGAVAVTLKNGARKLLMLPMDRRGGYEVMSIDVETGENHETPLPFDPKGDSPYSSLLSKNNKYYTHFGSYFVEYDPDLEKFTACHQSQKQMAMAMTEGPDGVIWSATYPNMGLVSYNPKTKTFKDYGSLNKENWLQYPRSLEVGADGWIYAGIGNTNGQVIAFNPKTKKVNLLFPMEERPNPSSATVLRTADRRVFGYINAQQQFEFKDGKRSPLKDKLQADTSCITGTQGLFYKKFADGSAIVDANTIEKVMTVKDKHGKESKINFDYKSDGCGTMSITALADGNIYGGTWFPMRMFKYNPREDKMENFNSTVQYNAVYPFGKYMYVGAYSGGYVLRYDCTKPITGIKDFNNPHLDTNPILYCKYSAEDNRPHSIRVTPNGKHVVMGGTPGYGITGGGLVIVNTDTNKHCVIPNAELFPNESVRSLLALPDNRHVLIGTTINAGTGGEVKAKEGSLVMYDIISKKIEWKTKPFADGKDYGGLHLINANQAIGVVDFKKLFVVDLQSQAILGTYDIPESIGSACGAQGPGIFYQNGKELLIALSKGIGKISVKKGVPSINKFAATDGTGNGGAVVNGRFYFIQGSHLKSINLKKNKLFKSVK